jgi:hypothetical protein
MAPILARWNWRCGVLQPMRRCWRQHRREDCGLARVHNRLKHFFPSGQHREHQIVYRKADLLKVAGRVPGGVAI